jgi:hypothetical protein
VEGLDLGPALGCEGDMLTDRMRVEAIYPEGVKPSMSVEGAVVAKAFESYIEHFLVPTLRHGQIVVMDTPSVCIRASESSASSNRPKHNCCSFHLTLLTSIP